MKKSIIILGLALVAFTNEIGATTVPASATSIEFANYENTPLCSAIMKGDLDTVKKFVEYGSDVNEKSNGLTPLMFAARYNKVEIIKYLVEKGADKELKDEKGNKALNYAEFSKSQDAVTCLK